MVKKLILIAMLLLIAQPLFAGEWKTRFNAFTGKPDWVRGDNANFDSLTISDYLSTSAVKFSDGTTQTTAGGGGSPGGSDEQVQYNNSGSFGGITNLTTDGVNAYCDGVLLSDNLSKSTEFVGDVTGTYGATVVGNDSHNHTNATITLASTDLSDTANLPRLNTANEFASDISIDGDLSTNANTSPSGVCYFGLLDNDGKLIGQSALPYPTADGAGGGGSSEWTDHTTYIENTDGTPVHVSSDLTVKGDLTVDGVIFAYNNNKSLILGLPSDAGALNANDKVPITVTILTGDSMQNVTFDSANNQWTIKGNTGVYTLIGRTRINCSSTGYGMFQFYDGSSFIGKKNVVYSQNLNTAASEQTIVVAKVAPTVDTTYSLRVETESNLSAVQANYTSVEIRSDI